MNGRSIVRGTMDRGSEQAADNTTDTYLEPVPYFAGPAVGAFAIIEARPSRNRSDADTHQGPDKRIRPNGGGGSVFVALGPDWIR